MTATVTVRTRAVGASVQIGEETTQIDPRSQRDFHVDGTASITVTEAEPAADADQAERPLAGEKVPGQEQNDQLHPPAGTRGAEKFDHDGDGKVGGSKAKA